MEPYFKDHVAKNQYKFIDRFHAAGLTLVCLRRARYFTVQRFWSSKKRQF